MIRITQSRAHARRLLVEGDLSGRYVDELRAACATHAPQVLDLAGVSYLDARGIALLEELAGRGLRFEGGSAFVRELLRRIPAVAEPRAAGDATWIEALRRGDEAAREALVRRHGPRLLASARRLLGSETLATDALREAFWQAFERVGELRASDALEPWLLRLVLAEALRLRRIAASAATDELPRFDAQDVRARDAADETLALEEPGVELALLAPEVQALVRACVDGLSEPARSALLLCDVEGLMVAEAASLLGSEPGATRAHLHRARQALRGRLGRALAGRGARTGASV